MFKHPTESYRRYESCEKPELKCQKYSLSGNKQMTSAHLSMEYRSFQAARDRNMLP